MSLSAGATLGPYEIVSLLGRGGMGEVYRARDARLRRDVAIKILPASFAANPDRRQRFEREAQMLASLNHPNIGAIYGLEEATGVCGLVLELVEGPTLAEMLRPPSGLSSEGSGLPLNDVLTIARQICDALDVAHEHGIVHRDLKPWNIKLTPDGVVKLLDFGIAKTTLDEVSDLTHSPTLVAGTIEGSLLGTVAYMSPEQARGRPLDKRTDIWSFGCVLYELLTGRQTFPGDTISDTIAATLGRDPDWSALPATTPSSVRLLLEQCLQKDPKQRLRDIGDARIYLRDRPASPTAGAVTSTRDRSRGVTWVAAAAIGAAILLPIALARSRGQSAEPSLQNPLANGTFTRLTDFEGDEYDAAISSDGKWVVFVSDRDGPFDVWLEQIGTRRFVNLTHGIEPNLRTSVRVPGFSGDGSQVWFHNADATTSVRIMPLMGGESRIFLGKQSQNVAWSPDSTRIAYHTSDDGDPMFVADPGGGNARQLLVGVSGTHNHHPAWSVDGAWIYFVSGSPTANRMDLWRVRATGGKPERLTQHNSTVGYPAPIDEHTILYVARDANRAGPWLWAFDAERKLPRRVSVGLEKYTSVSASADGRRLVATVANPSSSLSTVPILDHIADERDVRAFPSPARALAPRFGGRALFYLSSSGTGDGLWRSQDGQILEIWKGADGAILEPPAISKDGRRVAFVIKRNDTLRLQVEDSDGTDPRMIAEAIDVQGTGDWSPDGKWIVSGGNDGHGDALFKIPVDGGAPIRLVAGSAINPVWSARGNLIAYAGSQVGIFAPLLGVNPDGVPVALPDIKLHRDGERVRFLPSGNGLVYMQGPSATQDFWLLDLTTKKSRQVTRLNNLAAMRTFDVTPDATHIVFDRLRENSDIVLIELRQR